MLDSFDNACLLDSVDIYLQGYVFWLPHSVGVEASKIALQTQEAEVSARPLGYRLEEKEGLL